MSLKYGILGLINYAPITGYELDKKFKQSLNFFWQAQTSQIYRELNAMEKLGWIESETVLQQSKPNKKVYSITNNGKEELIRWLSKDSIQEDILVRDPFLVKLYFSGELNMNLNIDSLNKFIECCKSEISKINVTLDENCYGFEKYDDKFFWSATATFGQHYYEMCIKWAEEIISNMKKIE